MVKQAALLVVLFTLELAAYDPGPLQWRDNSFHEVAQPVAVGNVLIATGASNKPDGDRGVVFAKDLVTGKTLWSFKFDRLTRDEDIPTTGLSTKPLIENTNIYVFNNRGEVLCIQTSPDYQTAKIKWLFDTRLSLGTYKLSAGDVGNPWPTPVLYKDLILCGSAHGKNFEDDMASNAPSFFALDRHSGNLAWTKSYPGTNITYAQWAGPALATNNNVVTALFPGGDGILYGLNPLNGEIKWTLNLKNETDLEGLYQPARGWQIAEHFIVPPQSYSNYIIATLGYSYEAPVKAPLCVFTQQTNGRPILLWKATLPEFTGTQVPFAIHNNVLFAISFDEQIFAFDLPTGKILWRELFPKSVQNSEAGAPIIHQELLYVPTDSEILVYKITPAPVLVGKFEMNNAFLFNTPLIHKNHLVVGTRWEMLCFQLQVIRPLPLQ